MKLPTSPLHLPPLPFRLSDLEPVISEETVMSHYLGHHTGYVDTFNSLLLMKQAKKEDLEFNFFGHKLHALYWETVIPGGKVSLTNTLSKRVISQFGSYQNLISQLIEKASKLRGSGWVILANDNSGKLHIKTIENHNLGPILAYNPLIIIDCWEHAYYLDFGFKKKDFYESFVSLINWDIANQRYTF